MSATSASAPTRASLGRDYAKFWLATTTSNLGDGVRAAALPLLAASITREPLLVAGLAFASELPWLVFGLTAGAVADRVDRRRAMWRVETGRGVVMAALALAVALGARNMVMLYAAAFLLGSLRTLFDNAAQAMLPSIVDKESLERANGRLYAGEVVGRQFAGPPLGGLLFAAGVALPFIVDSSTFFAGALLIAAMATTSRPARDGPVRTTLMADVRSGVAWLWRHRLLRAYALILGLINLITNGVLSIAVLFALDKLAVGDVGYGLLLTAGAVGGLLGSLVGPILSSRLPVGIPLVGSVLAPGAAFVVLGFTSSPAVAAVMVGIDGFSGVVWAIITVSLRQAIVPDELLGRVNGVYRFVGWGLAPFGALVAGGLAQAFGVRTSIVCAGAALVALALVSLPVLRTRAVESARAAAAGD
jgi:MFS family permease